MVWAMIAISGWGLLFGCSGIILIVTIGYLVIRRDMRR